MRNRDLEVIVLLGGGHVASIKSAEANINPLWEPPWPTIDPAQYDGARHAIHGAEGRLLASLAGHSLCLDHFGELSESEIAAGAYFHGEAPNRTWEMRDRRVEDGRVCLEYGVELQDAGLKFEREITLPAAGSLLRFEECVTNLRRWDVPLEYQQHVTCGPPFVQGGVTRVDLPAFRGRTFPRSTGAADRLASDRNFKWPSAPGKESDALVNVFPEETPSCSLCTVLQEPPAGEGFIAIWNRRQALLFAYVFDAKLFPWTALWEENRASTEAPYDRRTVAWGIEFGSTPLPITRMENLASGPLFGTNRFLVLPARSSLRTAYWALLHRIPEDWAGVEEIHRDTKGLTVREAGLGRQIEIRSIEQ